MDQKNVSTLPNSEEFRAWVQDALAKIGISAARVAHDLGLGRNTLSTFLSQPGRSITLDTAHNVARHLRDKAIRQGIHLPAFGGMADADAQ